MTFAALLLAAVAADEPKSKFPVGKDTTHVVAPVDKNGFIDYPSALNDLLGQGVTAETNALVPLLQAVGISDREKQYPPEFYRRLGIEPVPQGECFLSLDDYLRAKGTPLDPESEVNLVLRTRPWTAKEQPDAAAWLDAHHASLKLVEAASHRKDYFHPWAPGENKDGKRGVLLGSPLTAVQRSRQAADALACRAMRHLGDGRPDATRADALTLYRLARLMAKGGSIIELLVANAIQAMAHNAAVAHLAETTTTLTAAEAAAFVADFEKLPPVPPFADKLDCAERYFFLDTLQTLAHSEDGYAAELIGNKEATAAQNKMYRDAIDWAAVLRRGNARFDKMAAAMRDPAPQKRLAAVRALEDESKKDRVALDPEIMIAAATLKFGGQPTDSFRTAVTRIVGTSTVNLLTPALLKVAESEIRGAAQAELLKAAFALAAYRAEKGSYPAALADLPKAVPPDPFGGKPLVYKPAAAGYVLYSVGVNGKDDDGRSFNTDPKGDDLVIRIPPAKK